MKKCGRVLSILFLIGLLIPGYVLASGQYIFKVPQLPGQPITVGSTFNVEVYLNVTGGPPTEVCTADYCVNYNQADDLIELVPSTIVCSDTSPPVQTACFPDPSNPICITQPPVDGGLFQAQNDPPFPPRTCDDYCTEQGFPVATNCATGTTPECKRDDPTDPQTPRLQFFLQAGSTVISEEPLVFDYPCGIDVPFTQPWLVSTLTFRALKPGCFQVTKGPCANIVADCDTGEPDNMTIANDPIRICISTPPTVPTISAHGTVIFALLIIGSIFLVLREYRRPKRSES